MDPVFIRIQSEPDREIENTLICADCAYFSIDHTGIIADFNTEQFAQFSKMLFFNFGRTIFGGIQV
jgi:hypothetical protein